jgi:hypothetical protein
MAGAASGHPARRLVAAGTAEQGLPGAPQPAEFRNVFLSVLDSALSAPLVA